MTTRIKALRDALTFSEEYTAVVVSTAHMPQSERIALEHNMPRKYIYENVDYGFRVYCCVDRVTDWPTSIRAIMKRGRELGHRWVDFDPDGPVIPGFRVWQELS